jgi:hypothetical protein
MTLNPTENWQGVAFLQQTAARNPAGAAHQRKKGPEGPLGVA